MNLFFEILKNALINAIPLLYGSTGEIITEKSGNLNLGIPGIMYIGGISGLTAAFYYNMSVTTVNPTIALILPFICAILASAAISFVYCLLTVTLRANQNITGLAITTLGIGVGNFFGGELFKKAGGVGQVQVGDITNVYKKSPFAFINIDSTESPLLYDLYDIFLSHGFLFYLAIIVAFVASYVIKRTRVGLNLRSVGENSATADAVGINVTRYKYISTCLGGAIAGLGGLYFVMNFMAGQWNNNCMSDRGWLAIALVIFVIWKPNLAIVGSIIFGGLCTLFNQLELSRVAQEVVKALPYFVTIVVLIVTSLSKKRETQPPACLGLNYFREER